MEPISTVMGANNRYRISSTRTTRNLERPRPLKSKMEQGMDPNEENSMGLYSPISEDIILQDMEAIAMNLSNNGGSVGGIENLCRLLKSHGHLLEREHKDELDRAFVSFRNAAGKDTIDLSYRLHLLEVLELRAHGWKANENMINYYQLIESGTKATNTGGVGLQLSASSPAINIQSASILSPGEVVKSSGKYQKPTRLAGKSSYKDEIVIRNADSGKVNSGVKDRLVQIVGPNEDSVNKGKQLIEETIRKNASPVREIPTLSGIGSDSSLNSGESEDSASPVQRNLASIKQQQTGISRRTNLSRSISMSDSTLEEYQYTVNVHGHTIKLSCLDAQLVQKAKLALEDFFRCDNIVSTSYALTKQMLLDDTNAFGDNISNTIHYQPIKVAKQIGRAVECQTCPQLILEAMKEARVKTKDPPSFELSPDVKTTKTEDDEQVPKESSDETSEAAASIMQLKYDREALLYYSRSPFCRVTPPDLTKIYSDSSFVVKRGANYFDDEHYKLKAENS